MASMTPVLNGGLLATLRTGLRPSIAKITPFAVGFGSFIFVAMAVPVSQKDRCVCVCRG